MWLANMNWLGVLSKKLAWVKGWVIVKKGNFGGLPIKRGKLEKIVLIFSERTQP